LEQRQEYVKESHGAVWQKNIPGRGNHRYKKGEKRACVNGKKTDIIGV
jgi:hypothetical protein